MDGIFYGIGVGPGDPELLTVKAIHAIKMPIIPNQKLKYLLKLPT